MLHGVPRLGLLLPKTRRHSDGRCELSALQAQVADWSGGANVHLREVEWQMNDVRRKLKSVAPKDHPLTERYPSWRYRRPVASALQWKAYQG